MNDQGDSAGRRRPGPLAARLARAPVWLYRAHLGFLLANRFLMLTHVGRTSGRIRRTVLEVVGHDPSTPEWFVVSGFGPRADWLLNIGASPPVRVDVGGRHFAPAARVLSDEQCRELLADYQRRRPRTSRMLGSRLLGHEFDATPESIAALAARLPAVGLRPR